MNTVPSVTLIPAKRRPAELNETGEILRVAAYCRVSTGSVEQQSSFETQVSYFTDMIISKPNWRLVGIFADEGISGTGTKNRKQFLKMIRMARKGEIDLIICKSISRFSRNIVDSIQYARELKSLGVRVVFEKENIDTSSARSEFQLDLFAAFAQAESESISKSSQWGIQKAFREGKVWYKTDQMIGYRLDENGKPYIIEEEAEIVRYIFSQYAAGAKATEIAEDLTNMRAKRRSGSDKWRRYNVYQILKNEKYAGDALLQKTVTINCITHDRKKNHGEKPMFLVQNCHAAIVDRSTFDAAQLELERRRRRRNNKEDSLLPAERSTKYILSRVLVCPYCGGFYKRTAWIEKAGRIPVWRCKNRMEGKKCPRSPSYHEMPLQNAVVNAINSVVGKFADAGESIYESNAIPVDNTIEKYIHDIHAELAKIEADRDRILSNISGADFEDMNDRLRYLNDREAGLAEQLRDLRNRQTIHKRNALRESSAKRLLKELEPIYSFDNVLTGRIISRIEAVSRKEIKVTFIGGYTVVQSVTGK